MDPDLPNRNEIIYNRKTTYLQLNMWFLFCLIFIIAGLIEYAWMCSVWYDQI